MEHCMWCTPDCALADMEHGTLNMDNQQFLKLLVQRTLFKTIRINNVESGQTIRINKVESGQTIRFNKIENAAKHLQAASLLLPP